MDMVTIMTLHYAVFIGYQALTQVLYKIDLKFEK
jgi:hypothetical protein